MTTREETASSATDPVMSAIVGARQAEAVILAMQGGCATPDALHEALQAAAATGDCVLFRSFARRLQKALERRS